VQKSVKNTAFYDKSGGKIGISAPETAEIVNFSIVFLANLKKNTNWKSNALDHLLQKTFKNQKLQTQIANPKPAKIVQKHRIL
jgi:hypothetical protein